MIRLLIRAGIFIGTAALGLLAASLLIDDVHLSFSGFLVAVGVFAIAQSILAPFIFNLARQFAPAMLGGIGLVSTFVALLIASLFPGGLRISGVTTWILATLVVWIVTAFGGWLLPLVFLKNRAEQRTASAV
ncbi:MAG: phage holin family protein [Actinomycetales bacterium]|nr:phage holin family protein [Actinomycetales bacterium]